MLERQREGTAKAKSEGKYKGRPAMSLAEIGRLTATMEPTTSLAVAVPIPIRRSIQSA